jgi:hypothetical protein
MNDGNAVKQMLVDSLVFDLSIEGTLLRWKWSPEVSLL